ncbi:polysaccharide deacetylase family protein [Paenibacillus puerhi]|uniref:polysaccharide deacetylase family protein n=1 Tax=Paenibacillus puerhi TaxID=2692622 RepID=UPI0013574344|nr:polysaccharide deacetylase family protein [Paenibacillus puerhi]
MPPASLQPGLLDNNKEGNMASSEKSADKTSVPSGPPLPTPLPTPPLANSNPAPAPPSQLPISVPAPAAAEANRPKPIATQGVKQMKRQGSQAPSLTLSQLARKYPDILLLHGRSSSRQIALTFDDAPDAVYTPQVLDILKAHKVRATFFLIGAQAEKYPNIVKRIVREGHVIGNHSYSHPLFTKLSQDGFQQQIQKTQQILKPLVGYTPRLIRPPYGEIKEAQLLWASEQGYLMVNWNVDSLDWKQLGEAQVTSNILKHAKAGSIVLQHSGGGTNQDLRGTVQALPKVIEALQGQGFRIVTLPELLRVTKGKK